MTQDGIYDFSGNVRGCYNTTEIYKDGYANCENDKCTMVFLLWAWPEVAYEINVSKSSGTRRNGFCKWRHCWSASLNAF